jgi:hypothetical protein
MLLAFVLKEILAQQTTLSCCLDFCIKNRNKISAKAKGQYETHDVNLSEN